MSTLLILLGIMVQAATVTITWDADSDPDVIGYRVQVDEGPAVMVGEAEYSTQLAKGMHTVSVKAVDFRLVESLPAVLEINVRELVKIEEESDDLENWTEHSREVILTAKPRKFFRHKLQPN